MHPADEAGHHLAAQRRDDAGGFKPANRLAHRLDATADGASYCLVAREARPGTVAVEVPQERAEHVQAGALQAATVLVWLACVALQRLGTGHQAPSVRAVH